MPPVSSQGGHGDRAQQYYGDIAQSEAKGERGEKKKDKGHGGMLLGAAGGLAAGAVGGAVIANALGTFSILLHPSSCASHILTFSSPR